MIIIMLGCCLIGGGLKGAIDTRFKRPERRIRERTPVAS